MYGKLNDWMDDDEYIGLGHEKCYHQNCPSVSFFSVTLSTQHMLIAIPAKPEITGKERGGA